MSPHRALMIVDVQRAFVPPRAYLVRLERYARRFPCRIFTRYINPANSIFRRKLKQKCCAPGSTDTELWLKPSREDLVFTKATYGLTARHIAALKRRKIHGVTVCGLDTDACVLGVMFSLFDGGIECHLKEQHCWSSSGLHRSAVEIARAQFPNREPVRHSGYNYRSMATTTKKNTRSSRGRMGAKKSSMRGRKGAKSKRGMGRKTARKAMGRR